MAQRLYRTTEDALVSGVCSGLARYFGIDPTIMRILFAIFAFNGISILIYVLLALVLPGEAQVGESNATVIQQNAVEMSQRLQALIARWRGAEPVEAETADSSRIETETSTADSSRTQTSTILGALLIALGLWFLLRNLGLFAWWDAGLFWSALLIIIGAALLWQRAKRG